MAAWPSSLSLLILGAIALQAAVGLGLVIAAFSLSIAWGWRAAMADRTDGRWSIARQMLVFGSVLLGLALIEACLVPAAQPAVRASTKPSSYLTPTGVQSTSG